MSYRFMRVIVMFDLPSVTGQDLKEYRRFRKFLVKNGFIMVQESIYSKLALNGTIVNSIADNIRKNKPLKGVVQMLVVTEKQYNGIEYIIGETKSEVLESDERLVIL